MPTKRGPHPLVPVLVQGGARRKVPRDVVADLRRWVGRALVAAGEAQAEMSVTLVGDREIRELNREFRHVDAPTDVLSFSMREGEGGDLHPEILGDVVISVETAARQAEEAERAFEAELLHLAVHGLAHLCGLDHDTAATERRMFAWEEEMRAYATSDDPDHPIPRRP